MIFFVTLARRPIDFLVPSSQRRGMFISLNNSWASSITIYFSLRSLSSSFLMTDQSLPGVATSMSLVKEAGLASVRCKLRLDVQLVRMVQKQHWHPEFTTSTKNNRQENSPGGVGWGLERRYFPESRVINLLVHRGLKKPSSVIIIQLTTSKIAFNNYISLQDTTSGNT